MKRHFSKYLAAFLALALLCAALALPAAAAIPANYAADVVTITNQRRAEAGLSALAGNNRALNNAAQKRAEEIATTFAHERPDGRETFTVLAEYGVSYIYAGENIAYGYPTAAAVMEGWMNSTGHRANILKNSFTHIGVGVYEKSGTLYCVQLFIGDGTGGNDQSNADDAGFGGQILNFFQTIWNYIVGWFRSIFGV
jgi:uncharacterized protein YkwD